MGVERTKINKRKMLSFAGSWKNMPGESFNDFLVEIRQRRKEAFSGRRKR